MQILYILLGLVVVYMIAAATLQGANLLPIVLTSTFVFISIWFILRYFALVTGAYSAPIPELPGEESLFENARKDLSQENLSLNAKVYQCEESKKIIEAQRNNYALQAQGYNYTPQNNIAYANQLDMGIAPTHDYAKDAANFLYNAGNNALAAGQYVGQNALNAAGNVGYAVGNAALDAGNQVIGDAYGMGKDVAEQYLGIAGKPKGKKGGKHENIGKGKGGANNMGYKLDGSSAGKTGPKPKPKKPKGPPKKRGPKPKKKPTQQVDLTDDE